MERQAKTLKHSSRSVVDAALVHFRSVARRVHRAEILADEIQDLEPVVFHGDVRAAINLHRCDRRHAAEHHGP